MTTNPIDVERSVLALLEATHNQDQVAGVTLLTGNSRDDLIAMCAVLANYCVSIAVVSENIDLTEWIPQQRQRLLDKEAGDPPVVG